MRSVLVASLVWVSIFTVGGWGQAGEDAFEAGLKALAAKDWDRALDSLESALTADQDNLRYGSEYRRAVLLRAQTLHPKEGKPEDFERELRFFEQLTTKNSKAANAYLNEGFAYVDKIPASGAITQIILANTALDCFTKSLDLRAAWIGYYTRGMSYLFWPKIFGRAKLGVADLETAIQMQKSTSKKPYHLRAWVALGDSYWKTDELEKARATWNEGLKEFPDSAALKARLAAEDDALKTMIEDALDPSKRVDTDLKEIWVNP